MNLTRRILLVLFTGIMLGSGCSSPSPEAEIVTAPSLQPESSLTYTPAPPTLTPIPPTDTPTPTSTNTPRPTATPTITPTFSIEKVTLLPGEPIKIGYLLWTGDLIGIDSLRGVEIALADFGAEILGHPIELIGYDEECNRLAGQRGAQLLIGDETVMGIIGTTCSQSGLSAAPIISEANRVLVSPSNTDAILTRQGNREAGYFRTAPNDRDQSIAVATYIHDELAASRLAVIYTANDVFQQNRSESLCAEFTAVGGECVLQRTIPAGDTYMVPVVNAIIGAEADAVFFMSWHNDQAGAFVTAIKASPELADLPVVVWERCLSSDFLRAAGENAVGVFASRTTFDIQPSDAYTAFRDGYRNRYGEYPMTEYHPYAYDAALLLLNAIANAAVQAEDGSLYIDPLAVREGMYRQLAFMGLSGVIACSQDGDCSNGNHGRVYQYVSSDPVTFYPGPAEQLSSNPMQVWP